MNYGLRLCEFKLVPHPQQNHCRWKSISAMDSLMCSRHQASLVPDAPPSQPAVAQDVRGQKNALAREGDKRLGRSMVNLEGIAGECGKSPSCQYSRNAVVLKRFQNAFTASSVMQPSFSIQLQC